MPETSGGLLALGDDGPLFGDRKLICLILPRFIRRCLRLARSTAQELPLAEAGQAGFEQGRAGLAHRQLDGGGGAVALLAMRELQERLD